MSNVPSDALIRDAVATAFNDVVAKIVADESKKAVANAVHAIEQRIQAETSTIAFQLFSNFNLERNGPDLRITVNNLFKQPDTLDTDGRS